LPPIWKPAGGHVPGILMVGEDFSIAQLVIYLPFLST
jgi:hypothetical protein